MVHFCKIMNKGISITQTVLVEGKQVDVLRLDLLHPLVNGNKHFKLKYNVLKAQESGLNTLLTFGGPYSNHIYATAAAGKLHGLKTIGIIRGEWSGRGAELHTPTLQFAKACGMQLEFVTNLAYAEKETEDFKGWLQSQFGEFYLVPEGGSNFLGVNGCMEILEHAERHSYDTLVVACGTGATTAGLLLSKDASQRVMAVSALKGGSFLREEVIKHLTYFFMDEGVARECAEDLTLLDAYHFGGYGKWTEELSGCIERWKSENNLPLDPVYTAKAFYALEDQIRAGTIGRDERVLFVHTGGLQKYD